MFHFKPSSEATTVRTQLEDVVSGSHLTILHPRDSTPSDILSIFGGMNLQTENKRKHRLNFFFTTLCFCLGLGNLWRFPRQAVISGNALYVYLYIAFTMINSTSVLFFELALGQYSSRGVGKIFSICPVLEGITFSIILFAVITNTFYGMLSVYTLKYIFTSFSTHMPHSTCKEATQSCHNSTPEHLYFHALYGGKSFSWESFGLLFLLWLIICILLVLNVTKHFWFSFALCSFIVLVILGTAITSLCFSGSHNEVKQMFVPAWKHIVQLKSFNSWLAPFEQSLVSYGLGTGPLLIFWSQSKVKSWHYLDSVLIIFITLTCTILMGLIMFSAIGIVTKGHQTISFKDSNDIQIHIIFTQFFNSLSGGLSNFFVNIFYLMFLCSTLFTMYQSTQVTVMILKNYFVIFANLRRTVGVAVVCLFYFVVNVPLASRDGFYYLMAFDDIFIGPSTLFLVFFEMVCFIYFYGSKNFCDDIEFTMRFAPNFFYQAAWFLLPFIFLGFAVASLAVKCSQREMNVYEYLMLSFVVGLIVFPVVVIFCYRMYLGIKAKNLQKMVNPIAMVMDMK